MTIDEKIQDFRQLEYDFEHCMCDTEDDKENLVKYQQEYEYYKQLADWLEELKRRREYDGEIIGSGALNNAYNQGYDKAIDDFANELHSLEFDNAYGVSIVLEPKQVEAIAEQLKEGGAEE